MEFDASTSRLQRCGDERLDDTLLGRLARDPQTRVLDWSGHGALVDTQADPPRLVLDSAHSSTDSHDSSLDSSRTSTDSGDATLTIFLGRDATGAAWLASVTHGHDNDAPTQHDGRLQRLGLRDIGHQLPPTHRDAFMTTQALASWHRSHSHCPRCGSATVPAQAGWIRRCEADGSEHYPRTDPAVIMAITDPSDRLLLARAAAWPQNRRSVLAGFVEPGEPAESAVAREVAEEVGLTVHDIRYVASQPWPFPASLMLGFTASTTAPELTIDETEIVAAQWYTREALRDALDGGDLGLPGRLSIARRLIENWYGRPLTPPREVPFHRLEPNPEPNPEPNADAR